MAVLLRGCRPHVVCRRVFKRRSSAATEEDGWSNNKVTSDSMNNLCIGKSGSIGFYSTAIPRICYGVATHSRRVMTLCIYSGFNNWCPAWVPSAYIPVSTTTNQTSTINIQAQIIISAGYHWNFNLREIYRAVILQTALSRAEFFEVLRLEFLYHFTDFGPCIKARSHIRCAERRCAAVCPLTVEASSCIFRPPGTVVPDELMFYRRCVLGSHIFKVPRPIAAKLCHMIGIWLKRSRKFQKFGGRSPKKYWQPKHAKFRSIFGNVRLWLRISPERLKISDSKRDVFYIDSSCVLGNRSRELGPLISEISMWDWTPWNALIW